MSSKDVVQELLISKMQPTWVRSEDRRLSANLTAENRKLYPDHPRGKPFRVVFFGDERFLCEKYYASIEEAHSAMNYFIN